MTEEPKKISFGFSKVSKKNTILQPKKQNEEKNDVQFIDCLEGKSIKLVNGQDNEKKELPIIPLRNGNLLRDSIKEVIKSRDENKGIDEVNLNNKELTLDELAAKEILEDLNKNENKDDEKPTQLTVNLNSQSNPEPSNLDDYESMPISDFGLAMLRGMGWDPKKGIGLNGKVVTPLTTTLRPKGMGLGADKTPAAKSIVSNGEVLVMKKGAAVKIINGPHNNLYGRIEGFDELPGRLMVRLAANNVIVSLNEIMVQLVSTSEFNKNIENNELKIEVEPDQNKVKTEKRRLNDAAAFELISSENIRESKMKEKYNREDKNRDEYVKIISSSESIRSKKYNDHTKRNKEENRARSRSPKYPKCYTDRKISGSVSKSNRHRDYEESRKQRSRYSSSSSSPSPSPDRKSDKKFSRRSRYESNSSDSDYDRKKKSYKSKQYSGHASSKSRSHAKEEIKYSSKYKNYHKR